MVSTLLILTAILVALFLAGNLLWRRTSDVHSVGEWETKKHEIDVQVFEALVDPAEEYRLRHCLPSKRFRYFQRKRTRLALRWLGLLDENTSMLMSLAQLARTKRDRVLTEQADEMIVIAIKLRFNLALARLYLSAKWLFPSCTISLPTFEPRYRQLLNCVIEFQQYGRQALT